MKTVKCSQYYNKVAEFMKEFPDATDERVYLYLISLAPRRGDEYGVPEFSSYELDHIVVKKDKIVFHHRGVSGSYNYDRSFVLTTGDQKEYLD